VLGRFHELSVQTADIRESVEFYERLGFTHAQAGDTWSHPYGVLTDGRISIGLHQYRFESPAITFVRPGIARHVPDFEALGIELAFAKTADDAFNEIGFRDPAGQMIAILEARTYSPASRRDAEVSLCGYFTEISIPAADLEAAGRFWEALGFVATDVSDTPYAHLPLTSDHLDIAFHRPRTLDRPMLVFTDEDMASRIATLRERDVPLSRDLPRGLDPAANALLEAPEGTSLLLLTAAAD
jgi:catechol 2,3-dioxygenase-like lactoylglutathione lyase family enzyme